MATPNHEHRRVLMDMPREQAPAATSPKVIRPLSRIHLSKTDGHAMHRVAVAGFVCAALVFGACGDSNSSTATPTPSAVADPAAPATTIADDRLRSTDRVAVALDRSILTPTDLAGVGITALPAPASGPGLLGPLTTEGIAAHFPIPGQDVKGRLEQAAARGGASQRYNIGAPGAPGPILTIIAVSFPTSNSARSFLQDLRAITPGLSMTEHAEDSVGVAPIVIDRFQPHVPAGTPPIEVSAAPAVYAGGVVYFVELGGPPGAIPDARVLDLLRLQDKKYQTDRSALGLP
jgi:hypothetical protein